MKDKEHTNLVYLDELQEATLEENVGQLLSHMRGLREKVPVNHKLKAELRKKLLQDMGKAKGSQPPEGTLPPAKARDGKINLTQWGLVVLPLAIIGFILFGIYRGGQPLDSDQPMEVRELLSQPVAMGALGPSIGAGGRKVYFSRAGVIWEVDANGQGSRALFLPPAGVAYKEPALAPDGKTMLVVATDPGGEKLEWLPMPGQQLPARATLPQGRRITRFDWSPDGGKVALAMDGKVHIFDLYGNTLRPVADGDWPSWSPDGKQLAIQRGGEGEKEIWLVSADGGNARFLLKGAEPDWSSTGQIVFVQERVWEKVLAYAEDRTPRVTAVEKVNELWVTDPAGRVAARLTRLAGPTLEQEAKLLQELNKGAGEAGQRRGVLQAPEEDRNPRWSADGRYIAAERVRGDMRSILWIRYEEGREAR